MNKKQQDYEAFVEKFKRKHTTDDCYTPPLVYEAVLNWARKNLPLEGRQIVRPFQPGGDYEHYPYPEGCVVVDNPPFSIFAKICDFYVSRGIPFLLFAPAMSSIRKNCTYIGAHGNIIYENGANVGTSFVTNMMGDLVCTTAPELHELLEQAVKATHKDKVKKLTKLAYPDCMLRVSTLHTMSRAGINFQVRMRDGEVVNKATNNRKGEFGNSILLSDGKTAEKLAAEKLAAERLAAERLELTEQSKDIIKRLNGIPTSL